MTLVDAVIAALCVLPVLYLLQRWQGRSSHKQVLQEQEAYCRANKKRLMKSIEKLSKQGMGPLKTIEKDLDK